MSDTSGAGEPRQEPSPSGTAAHTHARHLQRIREGQQLAGVCAGLAAYAEVDEA